MLVFRFISIPSNQSSPFRIDYVKFPLKMESSDSSVSAKETPFEHGLIWSIAIATFEISAWPCIQFEHDTRLPFDLCFYPFVVLRHRGNFNPPTYLVFYEYSKVRNLLSSCPIVWDHKKEVSFSFYGSPWENRSRQTNVFHTTYPFTRLRPVDIAYKRTKHHYYWLITQPSPKSQSNFRCEWIVT